MSILRNMLRLIAPIAGAISTRSGKRLTSLSSLASAVSSSASSEPWVLNAQTRSPHRPSLRYSSGGSGPLLKQGEAFCLPACGSGGQFVLASPKSTSTRRRSTAATIPTIEPTATSPRSAHKHFRTLSSYAAAFPVRPSPSPETDVVSRTLAELCSSRSLASLPLRDLGASLSRRRADFLHDHRDA